MKILIVDDERNVLRDFISESEGISQVKEILAFDDPRAALQYVADGGEVDLAFLDINMPEIDGIELMKLLRAQRPDLFITFLTAYSSYALDAFELEADGYILKPFDRHEIEKILQKYLRGQKEQLPPQPRILIRTFGRFDLFVDGTAVHFSSAKAKEMLALLVDKAGGNVTMDYLICHLWENRPLDDKVKTLYRMALKTLRETLRCAGAEEILRESRNSRSIDISKVSCDYLQLLQDDPAAWKRFDERYMEQYSWAEETLAYLVHLKRKKNL
ncbi:MAG: response regulator [Lachnospiraceae bacterium]|nr:response regulator [Lachnospiraceae bacterium]